MGVSLGLSNSKKRIPLITDSTGFSIEGAGEGATAKRGKRGWRKLHIGVNRHGVLLAQVMTESPGGVATAGVVVIKKTKGKLASVTGDATYGTRQIYQRAAIRGARAVVLPAQSASVTRRGQRSAERERAIRRVNRVAGRRWKKESG